MTSRPDPRGLIRRRRNLPGHMSANRGIQIVAPERPGSDDLIPIREV